ncbi:activator-dependent family glycosyltransferase [Amycolatopsis sp. NBC_01286]|uniref:activator-dependent family glycosyltransferase n=1 Tax=Amycolatopsis sp. NBC_01286 TaxID=2903560 RepID=UPI002E10E16C|nr:activator-dependent family glycosyltransferase [Amycolatopsis sp. NBC_01286]
MRILFTTANQGSMFQPMVPLAWALRTAGHEVVVATQPDFVEEVTQAGLTAVPAGRQVDPRRLLVAMQVTEDMLEEAREGLHPPYDAVEDPSKADWESMLTGYVDDVERCRYEIFSMIGGLVEFARSWQPDLVIWEPFTYAGAIAAKACGAAHARLLFGADVYGRAREIFRGFGQTEDPLAKWFASYGRKYGFDFTEDLITGDFTIDPMPASLQCEADLNYLHMRNVPYGGVAIAPWWLEIKPEKPRVALTMGLTATGHFAGYTIDIQDVLDALADLDVELYATVPEDEQEKLRSIPENALLMPYIPLHALASTCSVAINHAGVGTLSTFALHGVPQLTLPYHFDEPLIGRRFAATGAGLNMHGIPIDADTIRANVLRLLEEPSFTEGAARLRDEMHALPTPNQLVGELEALTVKHRGGAS